METAEEFARLAQELAETARRDEGVGTLGEKLLHRTVKTWLQPSESLREVKIGRIVVDAVTQEGFQEVQTHSFHSLKKKLDYLLDLGPVTVICPLPGEKHLAWIDPETGEVSPLRRVGRRGQPWDVGSELVHLLPYIGAEGLSFRLLMITMEEYRVRSPKGPGKRGAVRAERIPLALTEEIWLRRPQDFARLLPPGLPNPFTCKELQKAGRLFPRPADRLLAVLKAAGVATPAGMRGREKLYAYPEPR